MAAFLNNYREVTKVKENVIELCCSGGGKKKTKPKKIVFRICMLIVGFYSIDFTMNVLRMPRMGSVLRPVKGGVLNSPSCRKPVRFIPRASETDVGKYF